MLFIWMKGVFVARTKLTHFDRNQVPLCRHVRERANKNVHFKEHLSIKDSKASGGKQYRGE